MCHLLSLSTMYHSPQDLTYSQSRSSGATFESATIRGMLLSLLLRVEPVMGEAATAGQRGALTECSMWKFTSLLLDYGDDVFFTSPHRHIPISP